MFEEVLNLNIQTIKKCSEWFTDILDACEAGGFYIAIVFIVMTVGFLLSHFRVAMYVGSDVVGNTANKAGSGGGKFASGKIGRGSDRAYGRFSPGVDRRGYDL